jgi:ATP-binding cassette subfamily C protein CydCD
VALGCVTAALAIAQAALLATAISGAFMDGRDLAALGAALAALAIVFLVRAVTAWSQEWVALRCSAAVKSTLRMKLLRAAARPSPGEVDATRSGEIVILATRGLDALDAYFGRYLPQMALAMIVPAVVVVCLFTVDLVAGLTVLLTLPLIPMFMALIGAATVRRRKRRWDALTRLSRHFLDVVGGLPTLRVFGRAEAQIGRLERVTDDYRRESMATLRVAFLSAFALELAATLSVALVAVGIGLRLDDGSLDLRTGLFALVLAPEAYLPMRQLGVRFHAAEEGLAAADAAFRVIEAGEAASGEAAAGAGAIDAGVAGAGAIDARVAGAGAPAGTATAGEPVPDLSGAEIRLVDVSVRQPGRNLEAPHDLSAVLRPGELVALAGSSGVGKTTIIEVLLGLRTADRGRVQIVDACGRCVDLTALDRDQWHRHVAWVPQQPYCFPGTIAENVRLAAPGASDGDVAAALAVVGLAGLDPEAALGEGGTGVSSGQRRRIGVARALLRRGDLVLLDEPTAGLDEASEATVLRAIREDARRNARMVLLVAHRPAALAIADRVVRVAAREGTEGEAADAGAGDGRSDGGAANGQARQGILEDTAPEGVR